MSLRRHIILLTAILLLTSCTNEEVQEVGRVISLRLISDSTTIIQNGKYGESRAVDGINNNGSFIYPADFRIAVDGENFVYTAHSANTDMTSSLPANFPVNGNSVRIQAYFPSFKIQYSETPQTFVVEQNQIQNGLGAAYYQISDLMYGLPQEDFIDIEGSGPTRKVKQTTNSIPLVFEHKMVKIRIDVTTNGATVKGITLKNVKRSIDFNTADATFSNLATADDGLGDNVIMYKDATGTPTDFTCTALIPTQSLAANTQFIDVVIDSQPTDMTYTYKINSATTFESGKQYNFRVSVSMTEVPLDCEITNWNTTPAGWTNITETLTI